MAEQSERNTGTAGGWWNLSIRFKADEDFAVPNAAQMTSDIGRLLSEHFDVDPVYIDDLTLIGHKQWTTGA